MTPKWITLAGDLLRIASERFGSQVCNDYFLPETWTQQERDEFVLAMHVWNGDPENAAGRTAIGDFEAMGFLAAELRQIGEETARLRAVNAELREAVQDFVATNARHEYEFDTNEPELYARITAALARAVEDTP